VKPGFLNTGMNGQPKGFKHNLDHYEPWGWLWEKPVYEITINKSTPLIYIDLAGYWWRMDDHSFTDYGSIPPPLQSIPGLDRERFARAYMFHDSGYTEKGLWQSAEQGEKWRFVSRTRLEMDLMLREMIEFEVVPGNAFLRGAIYRAVRMFGESSYGKGDYRKRSSGPPLSLDITKPLISLG